MISEYKLIRFLEHLQEEESEIYKNFGDAKNYYISGRRDVRHELEIWADIERKRRSGEWRSCYLFHPAPSDFGRKKE